MADYQWKLRTYFHAKADFKEANSMYEVQFERHIKFKKNDKKKGVGNFQI